MSETEGQEEPTMEEILASIRKIISEDDEDAGEQEAPAPEVVPEPEPEPEPEVDLELEEEPEEDDVLELTEMAEEEDVFDSLPDEPEPEPEEEPEPEPEPVMEMGFEGDIDDVDPAVGDEVLMSANSSGLAMDQFGILSDLLTSGYQGSGNTLEDLVREMLKPMLRGWLDENLPPLVERMVAKEIARLSRTKKP
ncbi:DUF2497 domain-containing protein [Paremcibacter congregatus]|uniref:DUF2497 domain-containing protein n=1 Tax=Paremcibacter congregatus TaxID=2043170 RepID=UPI0030EE12FA|tara:strand:- start:772 stop:1353 length:582 start_codon:yes stop_codon:yes gene_type:complete